MTEKRFVIKPSAMVDDYFVIIDAKKEYSFPILESTLNFMFCKALNELSDDNEQLKKRIEYLERKIQRERTASTKQHLKWSKEAEEQIQTLKEENKQLKIEIKMLNTIINGNKGKIVIDAPAYMEFKKNNK